LGAVRHFRKDFKQDAPRGDYVSMTVAVATGIRTMAIGRQHYKRVVPRYQPMRGYASSANGAGIACLPIENIVEKDWAQD
jgi:hypothetical protein